MDAHQAECEEAEQDEQAEESEQAEDGSASQISVFITDDEKVGHHDEAVA